MKYFYGEIQGMFIVESIAKIRKMYHIEGKAIRAIAKELCISKNTVKKIIRSDETKLELTKYKKDKPLLGQYLDKLNELLKDNLKEPMRRRMTAKKIFEELKKVGYEGGYQSVNLIVREFRRENEGKGKQAFIPLEFAPGDAFQFDWGEEEVCLNGDITRVKAARITLCHSRFSLVVVYPNERLEMVMDAHGVAFQFFEGCCRRGIFDNMKTAIKKILKGKDRDLNEQFAQMASHYLFDIVACTPASGWEKGRVEKKVGDTRRNLFTPILTGETYAQINKQLEIQCVESAKNTRHPDFKERTVYEVYLDEKASLIPFRSAFTAYKLHPTVASSLCLVNYDTNSYSVECAYVGRSVQIKAFAWEIIILHESKIIGQHARSFGKNQNIFNPWHYVPILARKPGALRNGAPFKELMTLMPPVFTEIRDNLGRNNVGDKEFVKILQFILKYDLDKVTDACTKVVALGGCSATLVEQYLVPKLEVTIPEKYLQLKNPPDDDYAKYSKLYLSNWGNA